MHRIAAAAATLAICFLAAAPAAQAQAPYKILANTKVGGDGGFDYVTADSDGRKLYVARGGQPGHVAVFDLDTLAPAGDLPGISAHGATVNTRAGHGITVSKPVSFFDSKTLAVIKTLEVQGNPDGYLNDPQTGHFYILSHATPNVSVIDAQDGSIVGTVDLGGAPEQAVLDGKGNLFVDLEDKGSIAVVDTKTLKLTRTISLAGKGDGCAGLAMDTAHDILFAACREPNVMVILSAKDGAILTTLPLGKGTDGAVFNPKTNEVFSSNGEGNLTIIKENSPTSFVVEQTLTTMPRAKTLTLDTKTGKLFLIYAEFGTPPPPAPGQKYSRAPMVPGSFGILTIGK